MAYLEKNLKQVAETQRLLRKADASEIAVGTKNKLIPFMTSIRVGYQGSSAGLFNLEKEQYSKNLAQNRTKSGCGVFGIGERQERRFLI